MNKKQLVALILTLIIVVAIYLGFGWEILKLKIVHEYISKIPPFTTSLTALRNFLFFVATALGLTSIYLLRTRKGK
jgi:hypothetical protein